MQDTYMQAVKQKVGVHLDPRTKIIVLLAVSIPAFTSSVWYVLALTAAVPLSLLIFEKRWSFACFYFLFYAASLWAHVYLLGATTGIINTLVAFCSGVACRIMPGLCMGFLLLSTTTVSEFVASMERIHMPKQIIIPFSVMFRFFPTIIEEASAITDAMKMRGISFGKTRGGPVSLLEYRLVPLMISCVKIGDELSSSALTRGLGSPVKRTNICDIGFHTQDRIYLVIAIMVVVLFLVNR
jgi:ABC-type cobalt transport system, permease component CbiQ and related transporters